MKKVLLTFLLALLTLPSIAQIKFEKGYFITNSEQKTDVFIKNIDWKNNPTTFEYQIAEGGTIETQNIANVKEFAVDSLAKFIRATVDIDQSSVNTSALSRVKNPAFKNQTVFLRVLLEGDYSVYEFAEGNMKRYFYAKQDDEIVPLVYKQYLSNDVSMKVMTNNTYQQQLFNNFQCENITLRTIQSVDYNKDDLIKFFNQYSACSNQTLSYREVKPARNTFDLNIRPRVNSSSLSIENTLNGDFTSDYDTKFSFGIGLEAEFFLPYNKNKWSVFVEPSYQSYNAESRTGRSNNYTATVDYKSVEIPVGLRHYFYLAPDSKLFVNAAYVFSYRLDSNILFVRDDARDIQTLELEPNGNLALGAGYKYGDKYSVELRYQSKHVLDLYTYYTSNFTSVSLIFGYTIF